MSTRSIFGYIDKEDYFNIRYVHYDGYVEGVGNTLFTFLKTEKDIIDCMKNHDMSVLITKNGKMVTEYYDDEDESHDKRLIDKSTTYGENAIKLMNELSASHNIEYLYMFIDGQWYVINCYDYKFNLLEKEIKEQTE